MKICFYLFITFLFSKHSSQQHWIDMTGIFWQPFLHSATVDTKSIFFPFSKDENVLNFSFDYYEKINVGFIIEGYSGNGKEVKLANIINKTMLVIWIMQVLRCYPPYCISDKIRLYRLHKWTHGGRGGGNTPPSRIFGRLNPLKLLAG